MAKTKQRAKKVTVPKVEQIRRHFRKMDPEKRDSLAGEDIDKIAGMFHTHPTQVYAARKTVRLESPSNGDTDRTATTSIANVIRDVNRLKAIGDPDYIRELLILMEKVK